MSLETRDTSTRSLQRDVIANGEQKQVMHATWQPKKNLHINIETMDANFLSANAEALKAAARDFIADVCDAAAFDGVPV